MTKYFSNIIEAIRTTFEGLTITASHMFRKPITVQYPDRIDVPMSESMAPRFRGFPKVDMTTCTGCMICQQACPIQCIKIEIVRGQPISSCHSRESGNLPVNSGDPRFRGDDTPSPPQRLISKFDIDTSKCMFCGLCAEPCPTGAIHLTKDFEKATYDINELTLKFVDEGKPIVPYKKGNDAK